MQELVVPRPLLDYGNVKLLGFNLKNMKVVMLISQLNNKLLQTNKHIISS